MERFSMNEFKPLTMMEKKQRIEERINAIEELKRPVVLRKQQIEYELSDYKKTVSGQFIEQSEYERICKAQRELIKEKAKIERELMDFKQQIRQLQIQEGDIKLQLKRVPDGLVKQKVIELRDRYGSFASDTTRVSSMRAMASKFVEEMQSLLTEMN